MFPRYSWLILALGILGIRGILGIPGTLGNQVIPGIPADGLNITNITKPHYSDYHECRPVDEDEDGLCVEECTMKNETAKIEDSCTNDTMCCFNGCGHTCETGIPLDKLSSLSGDNQPKLCSQPKKTGKCKQVKGIRFYYDMQDNTCKEFKYRCSGNDNRFDTKMKCEKTCMVSDICTLSKQKGQKSCKSKKVTRFYYDSKTKMCIEFPYSGCGGGNANNFEDKETCMNSCDTCKLPKRVGPCEAKISRYFYNPETKMCEMFYYGGCDGNRNNFETKMECENRCAPTCEWYCNNCKQRKSTKLLSKCSECKQYRSMDAKVCDACLHKDGTVFDCFNCKNNKNS
ncbi:unnamed protein product [Owenia fusiformis]|uniref:Uncharacterized protein n=1 Tax=Owenia fusiformis TaxID=6347 RepID=A0A8J1T763_OWEFU|nr:unnamed protein product [Owenia fusiformis]